MRVSVGRGVKVEVAGKVSVEKMAVNVSMEGTLVAGSAVAVEEDRVGCPEFAAEQETVSNRNISSSICPFFIPAFYYCFRDALFTFISRLKNPPAQAGFGSSAFLFLAAVRSLLR